MFSRKDKSWIIKRALCFKIFPLWRKGNMAIQNFPTQFLWQNSCRMTDLFFCWSRGYVVKVPASQHLTFRKMCYKIFFPSIEKNLKGIFYTQFPKDCRPSLRLQYCFLSCGILKQKIISKQPPMCGSANFGVGSQSSKVSTISARAWSGFWFYNC